MLQTRRLRSASSPSSIVSYVERAIAITERPWRGEGVIACWKTLSLLHFKAIKPRRKLSSVIRDHLRIYFNSFRTDLSGMLVGYAGLRGCEAKCNMAT